MNLGKTFFFAVFLFFSLTAVAQVNSQLKITENFKGLSLDQVLDTLRQKYELNFAFDPQQAQLYTINQSFRNQTVEKVMESLLKNTPYRYEVSDNVILLVPQPGKLEVPKALHLQGRIVDEASGEPLPYAHISALGTTQGELSNIDGYFSLIDLDNPTGFKISYLGYQSKQLNLEDLDKADVEIKLQKEPQVLKELVVGDEINSMVQIAGTPSTFSMDPRKLNAIPVLGEADVMRSLQLLPGISATEETSAGLIVRGGTTDQNLVLFDGFTVYHLDHFYGIFSAFNPHSVKNIRVIKGGFDAKYGGRVSSVVEIIGKSGDRFKPHAGFGLNLISANVYAEIPIGKKASFIFSGRRSFTDIIQTKLYQDLMDNVRTNNIQKETNDAPNDPLTLEPDFYFYDFNTKFSYNPSHKDILAFSFYNGQDQLLTNNQQVSDLKLDITDQSKWGNRGMSGRWGRQWNKNYYSNLILSSSIFRSEANFDFLQLTDANDTISIQYNWENRVEDFTLRWDNELKVTKSQTFEFGFQATHNQVFLGADIEVQDADNTQQSGTQWSYYLQDRLLIAKKLELKVGGRFNIFEPIDKVKLEPRLSFGFPLSSKINLKGSWGLYHQFINRVTTTPFGYQDQFFWVLANGVSFPLTKSRHAVTGVTWSNDNWVIDLELYHKKTEGIMEAEFIIYPGFGQRNFRELVDFVNIGNSQARGLDFFLQKTTGKYTAWVSYSLSEVKNTFNTLNQGDPYTASHDQRHEINLVNTIKLGRWDLAGTWIYGSGRPFTMPDEENPLDNLFDRENVNQHRLPSYHRLDLTAKYNFNLGFMSGDLGVSILNVYNRKNVKLRRFVVLDQPADASDSIPEVSALDLQLLGITPNIFFNLRF